MNRVGVQLVKPGVSGDIQYVYANGNHMYGQTGQLNWTAEFNNAQVASLENGTYGINLYYVDKAGNVATQKVTFTLDNTRPLVKFTQAPSSFVNGDFDVSATFTDANGLDPSSLVLQVEDLGANSRAAKCLGGHPHVTVVSSTQVTLSCTIDTSMLQDGYTKYVVWAWGKDVAGNSTSNVQSSTNQSQVPFVVDRQAPSTPTLVSPVNRGYEKTNDFYFEWNDSSDASPVTYEFQSSLNPHTSNGVLDSGVWNSLANGQTLTDSSIHSTGAPDGAWYWQVRAIDAAGNKSDWTPVWKVTLDTSAPETTLVAPIGLTDGTFTVSGHATDNLSLNRVYVQLVSRVTNQRCGGTTINLIGQGTSADWLKNYDLSTLGAGCPDGQYAAHVTVVDMAGNVSSQGWTPDFTVDSTRPTSVRIDAPADGYLQSGTFTISGTAGDNPGGSGIDHVNVYVSKVTAPDENGKTFGGYVVDNQPAQQFDPATGVFSYDVSGLADGQYKIKAVAYDRANNYHFANTLELTVDSLAPSVTINTYSGTNTAPKLTGTVDDPMAKVFVTIDGNTYRAINNQDNTWGLSLVNPLSLGNHQASAVATDLADNTTPVAALTTLVVSKVFLPSIASTHREQKSQDTSGGNTTNNSGTARGSNSYTPLFATASAAPAGAVLGDSTTTSNDPANTDDQGQVKADETTNADPAANTGDPLNQCTKFFGLCWYWYIPIVIVVIAILYWLFKPRHDNKPA